MKLPLFTGLIMLAVVIPLAADDSIEVRPGPGVGANLEPFHAHYRERLLNPDDQSRGQERTTRLEEIRLRGQEGLRFGITMLGQEATVYDEIQMLRDSLEPVMRFVSALTILHQIEVFDGDSMRGYRLAKDASAAEPLSISPDGSRFAGGVVGLILAGLELGEGMEIDLPVFSTDLGPEMANAISRVRVLGRERVEAAARSWETWVIEVEHLDHSGKSIELPDGSPLPKSKHWVSAKAPYGIRAQYRADRVLELVEVR